MDVSQHSSLKHSRNDWPKIASNVDLIILRCGVTRTQTHPLGIGIAVFNQMLQDKRAIISACRTVVDRLLDADDLIAQRDLLTEQLENITHDICQHITTNASMVHDQGKYSAEYEILAEQFTDLKIKIAAIDDGIAERRTCCTELNGWAALNYGGGDGDGKCGWGAGIRVQGWASECMEMKPN